jgi:hypothetical protein
MFTFAKDIDHRVGCCRPPHANMSPAGWYPSKSYQTDQKTDCTLVAFQSSFQVLVPTLCLRATRTTCACIPIISQSSPCPLPPHPHCPPPPLMPPTSLKKQLFSLVRQSEDPKIFIEILSAVSRTPQKIYFCGVIYSLYGTPKVRKLSLATPVSIYLYPCQRGRPDQYMHGEIPFIYRTNNISRRKNIVFGGCGELTPPEIYK